MAYLVIAAHGKEPCRQKLPSQNVTLGRAIGCEIWIDDPKLSRTHCHIERVGHQWFIEDLGSTNGTWIQGRRVKREALGDGTSFEAGDARFVFHAGEFIANRPKDPAEAQRAREMSAQSDPSSETLVAQPLKINGRPAPAPKPKVVDRG